MVQIASVQEALRAVGRSLMRNHLRHCATQAISKGSPEEAEAMYDELWTSSTSTRVNLCAIRMETVAIMAFIVCYEGHGIILRLLG